MYPFESSIKKNVVHGFKIFSPTSDLSQPIASVVQAITLDVAGHMVKAEVSYFVDSPADALVEVNKCVRHALHTVKCVRFIEITRQRYNTDKSHPL